MFSIRPIGSPDHFPLPALLGACPGPGPPVSMVLSGARLATVQGPVRGPDPPAVGYGGGPVLEAGEGHGPTVHLVLQLGDVVADVSHQQQQEVKGTWRALGVRDEARGP